MRKWQVSALIETVNQELSNARNRRSDVERTKLELQIVLKRCGGAAHIPHIFSCFGAFAKISVVPIIIFGGIIQRISFERVKLAYASIYHLVDLLKIDKWILFRNLRYIRKKPDFTHAKDPQRLLHLHRQDVRMTLSKLELHAALLSYSPSPLSIAAHSASTA